MYKMKDKKWKKRMKTQLLYMNWAESRLNSSFIDLKLQNDWDDWNRIAEIKLR